LGRPSRTAAQTEAVGLTKEKEIDHVEVVDQGVGEPDSVWIRNASLGIVGAPPMVWGSASSSSGSSESPMTGGLASVWSGKSMGSFIWRFRS
jgi:hypothetical protein